MDPNEYPRRKSGNLSMKWMDDTPVIFSEQTWFLASVAYTWRQWRSVTKDFGGGTELLRLSIFLQAGDRANGLSFPFPDACKPLKVSTPY